MAFVSRTVLVEACNHRSLVVRLDEVANCAACCSLGACAVGRPLSRLQPIAVDLQAKPGTRLSLRINAAVLGRVSLLCCFVPAAMMLAGAGVGGWISDFSGDGGAIFGASAGLALCAVLLRLYDSRHGIRSWQVEPDHQDSSAGIG